MNQKLLLLLLVSGVMAAFEVPRGVPNASLVGAKSTISGLVYNTDTTLHIERYIGINESQIAKRKYNNDDLFDYTNWNLDELFPNRGGELAYQYYRYIPGVVWIENNFFIDETEISNLYWQEYSLHNPQAKISTPNGTLPDDYFSNPKYRFYPVTALSHDEAERFCQWRTRIVTNLFNEAKGYGSTDSEYTVFKFRLPTKQEWEKCAGYGLDLKRYPYGLKVLKSHLTFSKKAGEYLAEMTNSRLSAEELSQKLVKFNTEDGEDLLINCRRLDHTFLNLRTPFSIWSYPKNQFGIYNMLGNVAELVQERNLTKGGSWLSAMDDCQVLSEKEFKGPAEDIGFRTVCVLQWPNKNDM